MTFRDEKKIITKNDVDDATVSGEYFRKAFNRDSKVDQIHVNGNGTKV